MTNDLRNRILMQLEDRLGQTIAEILPLTADASVLSAILNRKVLPAKSPRDYSLIAYSSIYSRALPFMKAGANQFSRGEVLFLAEVITDLLTGSSSLESLISSSDEDSNFQNYRYSEKVEAERMAEVFLKTSGADTFESIYLQLLAELSEQSTLSKEDASILRDILPDAEANAHGRRTEVLNPMPGMASKKVWKSSSGQPEPESTKGIISYPVNALDSCTGSLDHLAPIAKDLLVRNRSGLIKEDSLGLSVFMPFVEILEKSGYLGVTLKIENGKLMKVSLVKFPAGEVSPPQFGPLKAMTSLLLEQTKASVTALENLDVSEMAKKSTEAQSFYAVSVLGAISCPETPNLVLEGQGETVDQAKNKICSAIETFVFAPAKMNALLLDPVAVAYETIDDELDIFRATRLSFYSLNPELQSPHHQGNISLGVDLLSYESACMNGEAEAKRLLEDCFSFLTGHKGQDQVADSPEEAVRLLQLKYGNSPGVKLVIDNDDLYAAISGKLGPNYGMSSEIYSLFYQHTFDQNPVMFAACLHVSRFLSNVRTYPQRFNLRDYLTAEDKKES